MHLSSLGLSHLAVLLIAVTALGAARQTRAAATLYGPQRGSQLLLLAMTAAMMGVAYLVLSWGLFFAGMMVVSFADNHFRAWFAERLGAARAFADADALLRSAGPARYFAAASVTPVLHAGLAILVASAGEPHSATRYLGAGMLAGAGLTALGYAFSILRVYRSGKSGAANP